MIMVLHQAIGMDLYAESVAHSLEQIEKMAAVIRPPINPPPLDATRTHVIPAAPHINSQGSCHALLNNKFRQANAS